MRVNHCLIFIKDENSGVAAQASDFSRFSTNELMKAKIDEQCQLLGRGPKTSAAAPEKIQNSNEQTDGDANYRMCSERWIMPGTGPADAHYNPVAAPEGDGFGPA